MFSRFFGLFATRTFWVIVGLIVVALLIWIVGPLIAIAEYRPLEPEWIRWTLIGLIFGFYLLRLLFRLWMSKNMNGRFINFVAGVRTSKDEQLDQPGTNEVKELQERFAKALNTLKKTGFSQDGNHRWWRPKQYLYQLPWYVFIGAPGSGKTTALLNSGLQFPLAEQLGKAAVRGVGGTRNCDWWFTNEAVLLDTAGRYTTQESNVQIDQAEWQGFLNLLKKFRPRQPINGVLLTISVTDLMTMTEAERELQAAAFRHRLNELQVNLNIRFPVYVLVTKCDMLAGFQEYFGRYAKEERAQVWGFTLPFDTRKIFANAGFQAAWFKEEFGALVQRIYRGLPEVLLEEQDLDRKAKIYSLPQHFSGLEELLEKMLSSVFSSSRYEDQALLRGVYFTSGTQDGSPFDRVLGILNRRFNVGAKSTTKEVSVIKGKSYFLEDLQKKVIFAEAHLAGRNFRWERKVQLLRSISLVVLSALFVITLVGWTLSYRNNLKYIAEVETNANNLAEIVHRDGSRLAGQLVDLFPTLDRARNLAVSEQFPLSEPPASYRFGLYQGSKLDTAAQITYRRLLEESLLPVIAMRIEEQVKDAPADNPEFLYEALKTYLMLHDQKHYDSEVLIAWVLTDWERSLPPSIPQSVRQNLLVHLTALAGDHYVNSPFEKNEGLVQATRQKLAGFTLAQRVYSRLKRRLNKSELPEFNIAAAGGSQAALVFARKSGQPITRGVPALFTHNGYHQLFDKEVSKVSSTLAFEEAWVLGEELKTSKEKLDDLSQKRLVLDVKRLYMQEYVRLWEAYLGDIKLLPSQSLAQSVEISRVLSGPDSPLGQFLRAVAKETTLSKEQPQNNSASLLKQAKDRISSTKNDLEQVFGPLQSPGQANSFDRPETIVDSRFELLRRLTAASSSGGSQLDQTLQLINELYSTLTATDAALRAGNTPPNSDVTNKLKSEAARLPMPLRSMIEGLTTLGANQIASVARAGISSNMSASVGDFCKTAIAGRYPIDPSANKDITPDDFGRMFGPVGLMDDFFQRNLAPLVDISKHPWTFRPGASGTGGTDSNALAQFQKAQTIRDIFFRGGARTPGLRIDIKPIEMDPYLTQFSLDIDGQIVRYAHGPQMPVSVSWPGPRGSSQIRAQISPAVNSAGLMIEGPWALHRLFDRMQISRGASSERFIATLTVDGRRIVFEVVANSVQNPFKLSQLETFQCPARL